MLLYIHIGQVTKKMRWAPTPDNKGLFLSLTISDRANPAANSNLLIPVSWGEFMVLDSLIRFAIPHFLGKFIICI